MQELPAHPHFECNWSLILRIHHDAPHISQEAWNEVTWTVENEVILATMAAQGFTGLTYE